MPTSGLAFLLATHELQARPGRVHGADLEVHQPDVETGAAHEGARHVVLQVTERLAADMTAYETERDAYHKQLVERKRRQARTSFDAFLQSRYQDLRQTGEISVNEQYVF